ncbi:cytochrome P450 [Mycobacterium sp. Dal123C01]|uniref:cytochrome P450 n=1 Tax=Mycobacterium sp. Dal123C01 TaxID=3457577 RepID=UPI00403E58DC
MFDIVKGWIDDRSNVIPIVPGRGVLVKHPDAIRAILTNRNYTKETGTNRYFRAHVSDGLVTAPPERHRRDRLVLNKAAQDHKLLDRIAVAKTEALAARLTQKATSGDRVDLTAEFNRLALSIIAEVILGWTEIDELAEALAAAIAVLESNGVMLPSSAKLAPARAKCLRVIHDLMERCPETKRQAAIVAMVDAGYDGDTIADQVLTLLLAGHETTANTLSWTWISLIRNPTVYLRWQDQLHTQAATSHVFTQNIVREGLRLYPSSWIIGRVAMADDEFDGVPVPAGCTVSISPFVTHRHPQFWSPDPEAFDPDRHNNPPQHRFAWLPFGAGARMCWGAAYALREMEIALEILGKRFRFHSEDLTHLNPDLRFTLSAPPALVDVKML